MNYSLTNYPYREQRTYLSQKTPAGKVAAAGFAEAENEICLSAYGTFQLDFKLLEVFPASGGRNGKDGKGFSGHILVGSGQDFDGSFGIMLNDSRFQQNFIDLFTAEINGSLRDERTFGKVAEIFSAVIL